MQKIFAWGVMLIMDKDLDEKRILQKKIIETVEKIEDADILEYLHTFIKLFLEKWG